MPGWRTSPETVAPCEAYSVMNTVTCGSSKKVAAAELILNGARGLVGIDAAQIDASDHGQIGEAVLGDADMGGKLGGIEDLDVEQVAGPDVDRRRVGHRGIAGARVWFGDCSWVWLWVWLWDWQDGATATPVSCGHRSRRRRNERAESKRSRPT